MEAEIPFLWPLLAGVFGLLIGSFLNVCIYRIPRDISVVAPRSFCTECGQKIAWYDNIPVLSFILLGGRCRSCGKRIGAQYPVVEIATAVLFACAVARYGTTLTGLKWMIFEALLIVLFATDLQERILPDELTIAGSVAGLILASVVPVPGFIGQVLLPSAPLMAQSLMNAATGACVLSIPIALIGFLYAKLRHRQGLGLGDVKLLVLAGIFLGVEKGVSALLFAAVAGSVTGLLYIVIKRKNAATYELPFGSFICAAAGLLPLLKRA